MGRSPKTDRKLEPEKGNKGIGVLTKIYSILCKYNPIKHNKDSKDN